MDYGGVDKRRTKGDLKRKRKNRVYKRGGQLRSQDISKEECEDKKDKKNNKRKGKKK